jgi:hypothetical protein
MKNAGTYWTDVGFRHEGMAMVRDLIDSFIDSGRAAGHVTSSEREPGVLPDNPVPPSCPRSTNIGQPWPLTTDHGSTLKSN